MAYGAYIDANSTSILDASEAGHQTINSASEDNQFKTLPNNRSDRKSMKPPAKQNKTFRGIKEGSN